MNRTDPIPYARENKRAQPAYDYADYRSTEKRHPKGKLIRIEHTLSEVTGPGFASGWAGPDSADLIHQHKSAPVGERIIVAGRVLDEDGRPVPGTLVELWQANAAGRYRHEVDQHDAPIDPNFTGKGQAVTDQDGNWRFLTVEPGHYPWRNSFNAWRAKHLHFSVFGPAFVTRLVTQMYFPGDYLLLQDELYNAIPNPKARERLVATHDRNLTENEYALGFRWDIVLRGRSATPIER